MRVPQLFLANLWREISEKKLPEQRSIMEILRGKMPLKFGYIFKNVFIIYILAMISFYKTSRDKTTI